MLQVVQMLQYMIRMGMPPTPPALHAMLAYLQATNPVPPQVSALQQVHVIDAPTIVAAGTAASTAARAVGSTGPRVTLFGVGASSVTSVTRSSGLSERQRVLQSLKGRRGSSFSTVTAVPSPASGTRPSSTSMVSTVGPTHGSPLHNRSYSMGPTSGSAAVQSSAAQSSEVRLLHEPLDARAAVSLACMLAKMQLSLCTTPHMTGGTRLPDGTYRTAGTTYRTAAGPNGQSKGSNGKRLPAWTLHAVPTLRVVPGFSGASASVPRVALRMTWRKMRLQRKQEKLLRQLGRGGRLQNANGAYGYVQGPGPQELQQQQQQQRQMRGKDYGSVPSMRPDALSVAGVPKGTGVWLMGLLHARLLRMQQASGHAGVPTAQGDRHGANSGGSDSIRSGSDASKGGSSSSSSSDSGSSSSARLVAVALLAVARLGLSPSDAWMEAAVQRLGAIRRRRNTHPSTKPASTFGQPGIQLHGADAVHVLVPRRHARVVLAAVERIEVQRGWEVGLGMKRRLRRLCGIRSSGTVL